MTKDIVKNKQTDFFGKSHKMHKRLRFSESIVKTANQSIFDNYFPPSAPTPRCWHKLTGLKCKEGVSRCPWAVPGPQSSLSYTDNTRTILCQQRFGWKQPGQPFPRWTTTTSSYGNSCAIAALQALAGALTPVIMSSGLK